MKFSVCLSIVIFVSLSLACSSRSAESEEVFIDDGYKTGDKIADKEEIVFNDLSFEGKNSTASQSRSGSQGITRIAPDSSQIKTMYDAFGNKTETRIFDGNPLLQVIAVRTSVNGDKQVSVFGQNGTVATLPAGMLDKILTAPASELAAAAGIFEGRRESPTFAQAAPSMPLQPMPSYKFPVQTPVLPQPVPTEPVDNVVPEPSETPNQPAGAAGGAPPPTENFDSKIPASDLD